MPLWCDLNCPEAEWPEEEGLDGAGSCRTFLALYCRKYDQLSYKNGPCLDLTRQSSKRKSKRSRKNGEK